MVYKFNHYEYFSGLLLQIKYDAFPIFVDSPYTLPRPGAANKRYPSQYL